jgi:signal transduction histidine kinase
MVLVIQAAIWGFGILFFQGQFGVGDDLWAVADVWSRYVVGVPGALFASAGLIAQQRAFRRAGMAKFGRDSIIAAIAFVWYGVVGQIFVKVSPLQLSQVINQDFFWELFGFPVQLLRASAAVVVAIFITRSLRSFEVEHQRQIDELNDARLREAKQREALRGELLKQVVEAQEAERQRIARELHDATGQALTALGLGLRGVATTIRQDLDKAARNLRHLEGLAVEAIDELRRLIVDLRPSHLDDLGLRAALRWYAGEIEGRSSYRVHLDLPPGDCVLPSTISTALFRVAQEALMNASKHARAENVWIRLYFDDGDLRLEVEDDGVGFNPLDLQQQSEHSSWGLLGMQERAALCGGSFLLKSTPGGGTQIRMSVPCPSLANVEAVDEHEIIIS